MFISCYCCALLNLTEKIAPHIAEYIIAGRGEKMGRIIGASVRTGTYAHSSYILEASRDAWFCRGLGFFFQAKVKKYRRLGTSSLTSGWRYF